MRNSEISLITLRFISPISDFYGIMNIQKYHLQFASNHYPFGSICRTRKTHKYVFYVRQCCIVLYADGFPHVPITTHQPNVYNLSLIHISEPTRLGMISYAVFCLKKKKKTNRKKTCQ